MKTRVKNNTELKEKENKQVILFPDLVELYDVFRKEVGNLIGVLQTSSIHQYARRDRDYASCYLSLYNTLEDLHTIINFLMGKKGKGLEKLNLCLTIPYFLYAEKYCYLSELPEKYIRKNIFFDYFLRHFHGAQIDLTQLTDYVYTKIYKPMRQQVDKILSYSSSMKDKERNVKLTKLVYEIDKLFEKIRNYNPFHGKLWEIQRALKIDFLIETIPPCTKNWGEYTVRMYPSSNNLALTIVKAKEQPGVYDIGIVMEKEDSEMITCWRVRDNVAEALIVVAKDVLIEIFRKYSDLAKKLLTKIDELRRELERAGLNVV